MPKNKVDPNNHDYNNDTYVTESDREIGRADRNKDGKVTPKEQRRYDRERTTTVSVTTEGPGGTRTETRTPDFDEDKPNWSREAAAAKGFTKRFLKENPDVARLLRKAIEGNWTEEEFLNLVETETNWGRRTTDAQAQFDLRYYGDKREDIEKDIFANRDKVRRTAATLGVTLTEQEINAFAFRYTRAALTDQDLLDFLSSKYTMPQPTGPGGPTGPGAAEGVPTGTASELSDAIRRMARSYGVTLTPETLQAKIQEGLRQGDRWSSWLEGQRNIFRQNSKTLYASISDKLDEYTLEELLDPYLEDASALLGISRQNMDLTNPMWTKAFTGNDGAPMTREQWMTTLRTDKQYGWNKTQRAKTEMAELGDELLRAFGMA